ncbi:MAG: zinc ribbon domain-containing protein [Planctomycetia bacterium]|nr:zinc ribbon domain-containing protein [Planctomycetia bacterium]
MPIYEYRCEKCGKEFEELVRGKEKPHCPACGSEELGKKLSAPAAPHSTSEKGCPIRDAGGCGCTGCCGHQH